MGIRTLASTGLYMATNEHFAMQQRAGRQAVRPSSYIPMLSQQRRYSRLPGLLLKFDLWTLSGDQALGKGANQSLGTLAG